MEAKPQKTQSGLAWTAQDGTQVEKKRLFADEIRAEKAAVKLFNMALHIQESLEALIIEAEERIEHVRQAYLKRKGPDKVDDDHTEKGFTFYSFNRDIKIEKIVSVTTGYKEEDVALSKGYFEEYLSGFVNIESSGTQILKELVLSAFTTRRGKFDYKKLDQLLEYKEKITNEVFQKAITLLEEAKFNNKPKAYYNIYFRNEEGTYEAINLKLSGVN